MDETDAVRIATELRRHGFFQDVSDEVVAACFLEEWPDGIELSPWGAEQLVLRYDEARALHRDTECNPYEGNRAYERWVKDLAAISRGGIVVRRVEERWLVHPSQARDHRPVEITVETPERAIAFRPFQAGDYVHPGELAEALNSLLPSGAPRLVSLDTGGQNALLVALDDAEKQRLERERGWRFHPPVPPPPFA